MRRTTSHPPLRPAGDLHAGRGWSHLGTRAEARRHLRIAVVFAGVLALTGAGLGVALVSAHPTRPPSVSLASGSSARSTQVGPDIPTPGGAAPNVGGFDSVSCSSSSSCVAVGAGADGSGLAETTTDAGATWTKKTLPFAAPELNSVSCSNTRDCVAVGPNALVSTTDGGSTWKLQPPPVPGTTALGVSCSSQLLCVAVGILPNATAPYSGEVFVSSDAGTSWSAPNLPSGTPALIAVACSSTTRCIAVGATILTTDDSGTTWTQRTVNGGMQALSSIACSSAQLCIALGPNPSGLVDPSAASAAIVSNDAGNTWNQASLPASTAGLQRLACGSGGACYAVGAVAKSQATAVAVSSDGGLTWKIAPSPSPMTGISSISCSGSSCVAVGRGPQGPASAVTTNGTSWTPDTAIGS